jgi:hypothetical protein
MADCLFECSLRVHCSAVGACVRFDLRTLVGKLHILDCKCRYSHTHCNCVVFVP